MVRSGLEGHRPRRTGRCPGRDTRCRRSRSARPMRLGLGPRLAAETSRGSRRPAGRAGPGEPDASTISGSRSSPAPTPSRPPGRPARRRQQEEWRARPPSFIGRQVQPLIERIGERGIRGLLVLERPQQAADLVVMHRSALQTRGGSSPGPGRAVIRWPSRCARWRVRPRGRSGHPGSGRGCARR